MLLLIMCGDLEVADRGMTPAIKLIFAQAFVAGSTSLVRQLMGSRVLHRGPFAECVSKVLTCYSACKFSPPAAIDSRHSLRAPAATNALSNNADMAAADANTPRQVVILLDFDHREVSELLWQQETSRLFLVALCLGIRPERPSVYPSIGWNVPWREPCVPRRGITQ